MNVLFILCLLLCELISFGRCFYAPLGSYVQPGSVLLPATRRGRYLANIIRRQAVDGTGIKFNRDADRINAESKKKADVLKEELIPYIVAEQERRTTLYKRIMTAIQNGEKGITVAEMRNKPPVYIKRGLFYRCPSNRDMVEPDGSGIMLCEKGVEPSPIMYESCLSAEDRELFVANNKYFFCNRHKVEGPDLPINGSSPIACAPEERTSMNYTFKRCALEGSDDVVVHYRYYPDKTYKYVADLDPEREVCDHWRPCQIGYIFSLPTPDQATIANELWHDYVESNDDYERDEYVDDMPDDFTEEFSTPLRHQRVPFSRRKVAIPDGYEFVHIECLRGIAYYDGSRYIIHSKVAGPITKDKKYMYIQTECIDDMHIPCKLFAVFRKITDHKSIRRIFLVSSTPAELHVQAQTISTLPGQNPGIITIPFFCPKCTVKHLRLRSHDDHVYNIHRSVCTIQQDTNGNGTIRLDLGPLRRRDFGSYFAIVLRSNSDEENVMVLRINSPDNDLKKLLSTTQVVESVKVKELYEKLITYTCVGCELTDVVCKGVSVLGNEHVVARPPNGVFVRYLSFEDPNACVYFGVFKRKNKTFKKVLAIIENNSPDVTIADVEIIEAPAEGQPLMKEIDFHCAKDCTVKQVLVNGNPLENQPTRRSNDEAQVTETQHVAFYEVGPQKITIKIFAYNDDYTGMTQAVFQIEDTTVTKNILEIKDGDDDGGSKSAETTTDAAGAATAAPAGGGTAPATPGGTGAGGTAPAPPGTAPTAPTGGGG